MRILAKKTAVAFLLLCCTLSAEPPVAAVTGPEKARAGDIIILTASEAAHVDWLVDSSGVDVPTEDAAEALLKTAETLRSAGFTVDPPDTDAPPVYLELDGGKRLVLASYTGVYRISLAVGNADGVDQCAFTVTVGTPKPTPKPDPKPDPIVEPVIPAGKFGLGIKSWRAAQLVKSANRPAEAKTLAAALLLSIAAADGQKMIDQFASTMKTQFTPEQKAAWEPWRAAYLAELSALQGANKLNAKDDFVAAFSEMALGLSAVEQ
jgi:hypothetical protein